MRKSILVLIFLICFYIENLLAQIDTLAIQNISEEEYFDNKNTTLSFAVSMEVMNVLYVGLDNPISITVSGYTCDKIVAKISEGTITKSENNYIVNVSKRGEVKIEIYTIGNDSNLTLLGTKKFRVKSLPKPEPQLGTLQNDSEENLKVIIANATRVFMGIESCWATNEPKLFKLISFEFITIKSGEASIPIYIEGNLLNKKCHRLIEKLTHGDKVIINEIIAEGPEGMTRFKPIVITVR